MASLRGLVLATILMSGPAVAAHADGAAGPAHPEPRLGLDLRVAVPDGVGAALTVAVNPRFELGLGVGTLLGTFAISPEATLRLLPTSRCTPTVTGKASTIMFTPLMDGLVNDELAKIYGDQVTVAMAGRTMVVLQGLAGIDCALGAAHFVVRAGYAWQPFGSFGGDDTEGELAISNWHGPAIDLGLRWRIR